MATCSAPGKIYLFGEHAVVYSEPAIACAIDLRTYVTARKADSVRINSHLGETGLDYEIHSYVSACIDRMLKEKTGVSVEIESDIPVGSGLGSSGAVTIATIQALNLEFDLGFPLEKIAAMGHRIETEVQGAASPTDTYVSTMGGLISLPSRRKLRLLNCDVVIGDTLQGASPKKTARLVSMVASLKDEYPSIVNPIIGTIGLFAGLGEKLLEEGDYVSLGKLMNIDHGMLDALGVGTARLSGLVYAARSAGAFGAKITGAGGGGCMVALTDRPENVARAIEEVGGKAIITRATELGVDHVA